MDLDTFERWMDERQGYDVKTILAYLRTIKQFIKWVEEEREIDFTGPETITAGLIRDYRTYLAIISKKEPATINKALQVIRIYSRWGVEEGAIKTNTALRVQYIEEPLLAPKSLPEDYVDVLRDAMKSESLKKRVLIEIGLGAGLRVSEVTNLRISDLKLKKRGGEIRVRVGKGFKYRTVPMAPDLVELLQEYLHGRTDKDGYVFLAQNTDHKMSTRAVQKMVENLRDKLGFYFTYHTLRHTYCADLLNSGMKITDVAIVAGHLKKNGMPNIATTARYVMSNQYELAKAVRKMARWRQKRAGQNKGDEEI
ncbi:site-specific recombinase XerD [Desulfitobacterium dehalogenans ATCC 51507]|uniref:Site-specific recombinase XerD n=1 Tax=Desulfitobacterium dehalogenans (strain ATCC 51507 / DSM 9161 / JW/IU-DC1) TaxID=756499 RepID=I4ABW7_DESDJ|nr:tyrosine-type recombinase/integrase [Desulfitobacterium dehalogenans]AFM01452.1 site-specific recombinase XerD [Desulfitobacterium dehalogenans ATCC 51507]